MIYQSEIEVQTAGHRDMHDLTGEVGRIVGESRVGAGVAHLFNVGSTGAIGTIEFEPGRKRGNSTVAKSTPKLTAPTG